MAKGGAERDGGQGEELPAVDVFAIVFCRGDNQSEGKRMSWFGVRAKTPHIVVAQVVEEVTGGQGAMVLLVLWAFVILVGMSATKTVMQEIFAVLVWIGGNQILTTGLLASRRRRYEILQREIEPAGKPS